MGIDPLAWLKDVLDNLRDDTGQEEMKQMLPFYYKKLASDELASFYLTRRGLSDGYVLAWGPSRRADLRIAVASAIEDFHKRQKDLAICNSCSNFALKQRQRGAVSFETR